MMRGENYQPTSEEAAQTEVWLQLIAARQAAGLTQAQIAEHSGLAPSQVSQMEMPGDEAYTLMTLRRYVTALGDGYALKVKVITPTDPLTFSIDIWSVCVNFSTRQLRNVALKRLNHVQLGPT